MKRKPKNKNISLNLKVRIRSRTYLLEEIIKDKKQDKALLKRIDLPKEEEYTISTPYPIRTSSLNNPEFLEVTEEENKQLLKKHFKVI